LISSAHQSPKVRRFPDLEDDALTIVEKLS
jgi:hypothetical protein